MAVSIGTPYLVLPAFHGGLLNEQVAQREVGRVLSGENPVGDGLLNVAEHISGRSGRGLAGARRFSGAKLHREPLGSAKTERPVCARGGCARSLTRWL
jgi:hypothetical protein